MNDLDTNLEEALREHLGVLAESRQFPILRDAVISQAKYWIREVLDDLRSDRPFDSGAYRNLDSREPFDSDQYNTETKGYREALTDVELALRSKEDG